MLRFRKEMQKRPMFYQLLGAFSVFIGITFLMNLVFYLAEAHRSGEVQQEYISNTLVSRTDSLQGLLYKISDDTAVLSSPDGLAKIVSSPTLGQAAPEDLESLEVFLQTYVQSRMAFDQISYYFESSGTLIGFDSEPYVIADQDSILEKLSLTEDAWNLLIKSDTSLLSGEGAQERSLMVSSRIFDRCVVLRRIPNSTLRNYLIPTSLESAGSQNVLPFWELGLIDQRGTVACWGVNAQGLFFEPESSPFQALPSGQLEESGEISTGGERWQYLSCPMWASPSQIVLLYPNASLARMGEYILRWMVFCTLPLMLLGGILAFFLSKAIYQPVEQAMQMLPESLQNSAGTEHKRISSAFAILKEENKKLEHLSASQDSQLKTAFLQNLLGGNLRPETPVAPLLEHYQIKELFGCYHVFLFRIDSTQDRLELDDNDHFLVLQSRQMEDKVKELFFRASPEQAMVRFIPYGMDLVGIASWLGNPEEWEPQSYFLRLSQLAEQQCQLSISIFYSARRSDAAQLSQAYQEVLAEQEYHAEHNGHRSVCQAADNLAKGNVSIPFRKLLAEEQRLAVLLAEGEYKDASAIFDRAAADILQQSASPIWVKAAITALVHTAAGLLAEESQTPSQEEAFRKILKAKRTDELIAAAKELFSSLESPAQTASYSQRFESIQSYIQDHYHEVSLSAQGVAEHLGISMSSLTRELQKSIGLTFSEYLHQLRLKDAKQMLRQRAVPLRTIAQEAGYANVLTMVRAFKKYEGMTPGEYRALNTAAE